MNDPTPIGRMTLRRNTAGDGQKARIRLWSIGVPKEGTTQDKLLKHYLRTFENVDALDARKKELKGNAELTELGRQRKALDFAFGSIMPDTLRGRRTLQKAAMEVASKRAKLKTPTADPSDFAAALRRQELRAALRAMDNKSRDDFLKQHGQLSGLDPEISLAITEQPAALSGVSESLRDDFLRQSVESGNAALLEEINDLERAIEIASSAIKEASDEVQREAIAVDVGFADPDRFQARVVEVAKLADQPWLKSFDGVLKKFEWNEQTKDGRWKTPTDEEIETGILADSKDEFDRLKVAAPLGAFGSGEEARKLRAQFIDERGIDAYLARNKVA